MTTSDMVNFVKRRTRLNDDVKIIGEIQTAYRWAQRRIFNSSGGPDLLITMDEEKPIAALTSSYDFGANLSGEILAMKQLWAKLPNEAVFTPMVLADTNSLQFIRNDSTLISTPATGHPIFYDMLNYNQARFSPALPANSTLRVDYYRLASAPDPTTNPSLDPGTDLPSIFHDAVASKATAQIFGILDDDREVSWERRALDEIQDAFFVADARSRPQPIQTQPFRSRRRRFI